MSVLVPNTDPVLHTETNPFDFELSPIKADELVATLKKILKNSNGLGLSANQIGLPYKVFVLVAQDDTVKEFFNPVIVTYSDETVVLDEACLSWPGLAVKIKRPKHLRIRYQKANGEIVTDTFTGMTARCIQHEMDHLAGKNYFDGANRYHRDVAFKKYRRLVK